jgi:hypothetical protein
VGKPSVSKVNPISVFVSAGGFPWDDFAYTVITVKSVLIHTSFSRSGLFNPEMVQVIERIF